VLCLSLLVVVVDNTIVNVALPTLAQDLSAGTSALQWIVDAYALVFAGLLLTAGSFGDRRGRKGTLTAGLLIFAGASGAGALATTANQLIAARAVMGVGAALVMPATLSILTNVFTDAKERAKAIGLWTAVAGVAIALGPVCGGLLLNHFSWGSIFLVNIPIVAIAVGLGAKFVPPSRDPSTSKLDLGGAVLSMTGLGLLVWALIEAPSKGWTDSHIVGAFAAALAVLAAFVRYELRVAEPMLNVRFFLNARFTAANISITFMFFALSGFIFGAAQYLQSVQGNSPLGAGVRTLPFAGGVMLFAGVSPIIARNVGTKWTVAGGLGLFTAGLVIAAATFGVDSGYTPVFFTMLAMGAGLGLAMAPATESVMGSLPKEKAGVGSAMSDTTREVGGTLGVAVGGSLIAALYAGKLDTVLHAAPVPPEAAEAAKSSIGGALSVARSAGAFAEPLRTAAREAFVHGLRADVLISAAAALAAVMVALVFLPSRANDAEPAELAATAVPDEPVITRLPGIDVPSVDVHGFDVAGLDVPGLDVPGLDVPSHVPSLDLVEVS
jgi:EmrB/QacA subfamily drug resistance transporter